MATPVCEMLRIKRPIVEAPMAAIPGLAAAVLFGAVVAARQREDQRIAALKLAEPTHRAPAIREIIVRKDAARSESDVRAHGTHGRTRGRPWRP